jgi:serine/threonine protein kinase/formylglycine-generating enzyme required for sulfatase activity
MTNLIGTSLGRYHILEQLGEGGMATVYKAYDTRLEREVAVKVIRREAFPAEHHARIFKRFEREARALSKLNHPHIVRVGEYGEYDNSPFLVMEFITGGTLKQKLGSPLPWVTAIQLVLPIAQALYYAHTQGIIHRDVKPSNILIASSGETMLTDFGIAKLLESDEGQTLSTTTGVGVGTPEYMSPEQGLGKEVDARADIYSLGIVLYELVTGRKPFRADTPMAVIVKHINDPLPRPRQFVRDLPESLERVLFKALAKKPEDRYKDMAQFAKALDGLLEPIREKEKALARQKEEAARKAAETARKAEAKKKAQEERLQRRIEKEKTRNRRPLLWIPGVGLIIIILLIGIKYGIPRNSTPTPAELPSHTAEVVSLSASPTVAITRQPPNTATPVPLPTYREGNILFEADFESSKISDLDFTVGSGDPKSDLSNPAQYWSILQDENGNHYLNGDATPNIEIAFKVGSPNWSNYVVEAKFNAQRLPTNGQGGAQFHIRGGGSGLNNCPNGYEFHFGEWLSIYNECAGGHLVNAPQGKIEEGKWYSIRIESFQGEFREYVDGTLINRLLDDTSLNGSMMIGTGRGGNVYYDDIRIAELLPAQLGEQIGSVTLPYEITDKKGIVMEFVPGGKFNMGSNDISSNEKPIHSVIIDPFFIDKYEVLNVFYKKCVDTGVCPPPKQERSYSRPNYFGIDEFAFYPVIYVDWEMAMTYCGWRGGRLPTEAEWELSAAGNTGRVFPWSESYDISCKVANYDGGCGVGDTRKAGYYPEGTSIYGLFDMSGNVAEWTSSLYMPYPYNPNDGRESITEYGERSVRGGSWNSPEGDLRSAFRSKVDPQIAHYLIGFRCASSVP